ncbi:hypothetical protein FACS1894195_5120 [Bacteroidia bacterium]|nr:hypothetical protein FACS1894195_5120 [Bacteroidia bacterium]
MEELKNYTEEERKNKLRKILEEMVNDGSIFSPNIPTEEQWRGFYPITKKLTNKQFNKIVDKLTEKVKKSVNTGYTITEQALIFAGIADKLLAFSHELYPRDEKKEVDESYEKNSINNIPDDIWENAVSMLYGIH